MRVPFDYIDKICLAAASREHGISSAPTWQLHVEGDFDEEVARRAIGALARRYPLIASRAVSLDEGKAVDETARVAYQMDPAPRVDDLFRVVDLSGAPDEAFEELRQEIFDHYMELSEDYPVQVTWARRGSGRGVLFLQQHHAVADGRAFFELLEDLCRFYDQALEGRLPDEIAPVPKLSEAWVAVPSPWRRAGYLLLGGLMHVRNLIRYLLRPLDPLASNTPLDFTGHNQVRHLHVEADELARIRQVRGAAGFSTNDVLTAALGLSLADWSAAHDHPVRRFNLLCPTDLRPRDGELRSFANHLSSFLVDVDPRGIAEPMALLASVRRQILGQARRLAHRKKIVAEIAVARGLTVARIRRSIYENPRVILNFPFSNLASISPTGHGGRFATSRWSGEALRIQTPCAWRQGVNTTVIRYAGRLCFNFNHTESAIGAPMVDDLIARYHQRLGALVDEALQT
jgi:hypothetical protein